MITIPVTTRCHADYGRLAKWRPSRKLPRINRLLVFDTETTTDATQALLYGRALLGSFNGECFIPTFEYLFSDCEIADSIIDAGMIGDHYESNQPPHTELRLMSRFSFLEEVLWPLIQDYRALIGAFNAPFDFSRLALRYSNRLKQNGFLFEFWPRYKKDGKLEAEKWRPKLTVDHGGRDFSFFNWGGIYRKDNTGNTYYYKHLPRNVFDLRTLIFALTSERHSLNSAAKEYLGRQKLELAQHGAISRESLAYNRQDVLLTFELADLFLRRHRELDINLPATRLYSPASIDKAYKEKLGIPPRLIAQPDFPKEHLGYAMVAYSGGRSETHISGCDVPIVHVDFTSDFTTCIILGHLEELMTAEKVVMREATDELQATLQEIADNPDLLLDQTVWPKLRGIALIKPDDYWLPVYGNYSSQPRGGFPNYTGPETAKFLPDLAAMVHKTGVVPKLIRAWHYDVQGISPVNPVRLLNVLTIDPKRSLYLQLAEERIKAKHKLAPYDDLGDGERESLSQMLKIFTHIGSYGVFAEINEKTSKTPVPVTYYGMDSVKTTTTRLQKAGKYYFPPVAGLITSYARLLLAVLERSIADRGGTWVCCDTDSMIIAATEFGEDYELASGELIRCLSFAQIREIVTRFEKLNPYDKKLTYNAALECSSILEVHKNSLDASGDIRQVYCHALSTKRYAVFTRAKKNEREIVKLLDVKESSFGDWRDGRKMARVFWWWILSTKKGQKGNFSGMPHQNDPCIADVRITTPRLRSMFKNKLPPFTFAMRATGESKRGAFSSQKHTLIAPLGSPAWTCYQTGEIGELGEKWDYKPWSQFCVDYFNHPEAQLADEMGCQPNGHTIGLLHPLHVQALDVGLRGKEASEDQEDTFEAPDNTLYEREEDWSDVLAVLRTFPRQAVADDLDVTVREINNWLAGRSRPDVKVVSRYVKRKVPSLEAFSAEWQEMRSEAIHRLRAMTIRGVELQFNITKKTAIRWRRGDVTDAGIRKVVEVLS